VTGCRRSWRDDERPLLTVCRGLIWQEENRINRVRREKRKLREEHDAIFEKRLELEPQDAYERVSAGVGASKGSSRLCCLSRQQWFPVKEHIKP
jgi:hypothetical protein